MASPQHHHPLQMQDSHSARAALEVVNSELEHAVAHVARLEQSRDQLVKSIKGFEDTQAKISSDWVDIAADRSAGTESKQVLVEERLGDHQTLQHGAWQTCIRSELNATESTLVNEGPQWLPPENWCICRDAEDSYSSSDDETEPTSRCTSTSDANQTPGPAEEDIKLDSYTDIDLGWHNLRAIPRSLHIHTNEIISLSLSRNPRLEIPLDFIQSCTALQELRLSHMAMKEVPHSVKFGLSLLYLDLSCNRIANVDRAYFDQIPGLQELQLHHNRMEKLAWYFPRMRSLTTLNISHNKFCTIPPVVCALESLRDLDVSFNLVQEIPEEIGQLNKMERFIILGNQISRLPDEMGKLVSLRHLDCRGNLIWDLGAVSKLANLETLCDDHNVNPQPARPNTNLLDRVITCFPSEVSPPTGHIAIVFTDIRNSTHLWQSNPGMPTAVRIHNSLLRRQLRFCGGYEVKTEGDSFMCSFPTSVSALRWCLAVQQQLLEEEWPLEILECPDGQPIFDKENRFIARGLSVRMGIHCGTPICEPDPINGRMDYFGPMVNRAARIMGCGNGGQILCSADVMKEVKNLESHSEAEGRKESVKAFEVVKALDMVVVPVGKVSLRGLDDPEMLSLVYPSSLEGRKQISNSSLRFDAAELEELGELCRRLEGFAGLASVSGILDEWTRIRLT
ncbi:nucleotide cyclase [Mycena floridula]|nr:nucleotide cyclase [Mycena floridula]